MSTLALRFAVSGQSQAQGEVKQFAGGLDVVTRSAQRMRQGLRDTGTAASMAGRNVVAMTQDSSANLLQAENRAKAFGVALARAAKEGVESWTGMQLSIGGVIGKIKEAHDALGNFQKRVGQGMVIAGVAQGAAVGNAVQNAGQVQGVEGALKTNLKGSSITVEEMMEELKKFDADSQLDFLESSKTANRMVAKGFDPQEVVPTMRVIGDAVGSQMGTQEDFEGIARALAQIKSRGGGQYSSEEGNQLAERGINANRMISEATGVSEGDIQSGNHEITGDQALKAILEGMKKFEGGMASAAQTLPGKIATFQGAIFQLNAAIGKYLLPPITWMIGAVTSLVGVFNNLPAPVHAIIGYSMAFNSGLLILGGTLLMIAGPLMSIWGTFKLIKTGVILANSALGLFGTSLGKVALQLGGKLLPLITGGMIPAVSGFASAIGGVLLPALGAMALGVITAAAIIKGIQWWNDAKTLSDSENEEKNGVVGWFHNSVGRWAGDNSEVVTKEDRQLYEHYKNRQEKSGAPVKSLADWKGHSTASDEASGDTPEQNRARREKLEKDKMMGQFGGQIAMLQTGGMNAADFPMTTITGIANLDTGDEQVSALQAEIYALQDALRAADKDAKPALRDRLVAKQRQMTALRKTVSAENRIANAAEREQKKQERIAAHREAILDAQSDDANNVDIEALRSELARTTDPAKRAGIQERIRLAGIARKTRKEEIDNMQLDFEIREAEAEESFNTRIVALEAQLEAARHEKNEAREAALNYEIDVLQAERDYQISKIRAGSTGLENEKRADADLQKAEIRKRGAMQQATIKRDADLLESQGYDPQKLREGGSLPGLPTGLLTAARDAAIASVSGVGHDFAANTQRGQLERAFEKHAGIDNSGKGGGAMYRPGMYDPARPTSANGLAAKMRASSREWVTRGRLEAKQNANGKITLKVIVDEKEIDNPLTAMGSRI
jgi:hypothetical protein